MRTTAVSSLVVFGASFAYGMDNDDFARKRAPVSHLSSEEFAQEEANKCLQGLEKIGESTKQSLITLTIFEQALGTNIKPDLTGNNRVAQVLSKELREEVSKLFGPVKELESSNLLLLKECEELSKNSSESLSLKFNKSIQLGYQNIETFKTLRKQIELVFGATVALELDLAM